MFSARPGLIAAGTMALGASLVLGTAATAVADDVPAPPNCTSADMAGILTGVTAATSVYLFTHPEVNAYFTSLKNLPKDQRRAQVRTYLDANPQVLADLEGIRQPSVDFSDRCSVAP